MIRDVRLALPFAALGAAGGMVATYKAGGDDGAAVASALFAATIPAVAGFLFNAQLGAVHAPLPAWARPIWVFAAGVVLGAVVRVAGGITIDPGVAGAYVLLGVLAAIAVMARFGIARYLGALFARSPWVSAVVMLVASFVMGLSSPGITVPGFALVLAVAARGARSRANTLIYAFDARSTWAAAALWLAVCAGVAGYGLPGKALGPFVQSVVAGLVAVVVLLMDASDASDVRRLLRRPRVLLREPTPGVAPGYREAPKAEPVADPLAEWVDFGVGEGEWRFGHAENFVYGMGDPEAARRAARDALILDLVTALVAVGVFVVELRRIR